jgi:hypothetical protein
LVQEVAAAEAMYWPAAHGLHRFEAAPVVGRKVPWMQSTQRV